VEDAMRASVAALLLLAAIVGAAAVDNADRLAELEREAVEDGTLIDDSLVVFAAVARYAASLDLEDPVVAKAAPIAEIYWHACSASAAASCGDWNADGEGNDEEDRVELAEALDSGFRLRECLMATWEETTSDCSDAIYTTKLFMRDNAAELEDAAERLDLADALRGASVPDEGHVLSLEEAREQVLDMCSEDARRLCRHDFEDFMEELEDEREEEWEEEEEEDEDDEEDEDEYDSDSEDGDWRRRAKETRGHHAGHRAGRRAGGKRHHAGRHRRMHGAPAGHGGPPPMHGMNGPPPMHGMNGPPPMRGMEGPRSDVEPMWHGDSHPDGHHDDHHGDRHGDEDDAWSSHDAKELGECMEDHMDQVSDECAAAMDDLRAAIYEHQPVDWDRHHWGGHHGCGICGVVIVVVITLITVCVVRRCRRRGRCKCCKRRGAWRRRFVRNGYLNVATADEDNESVEMATPVAAAQPVATAPTAGVAVVAGTPAAGQPVASAAPVVVAGTPAAGTVPTMQFVNGMWVQVIGTPSAPAVSH